MSRTGLAVRRAVMDKARGSRKAGLRPGEVQGHRTEPGERTHIPDARADPGANGARLQTAAKAAFRKPPQGVIPGERLLVLTGERVGGRHLIRLDGQEVWLPRGPFIALCKLAWAMLSSRTGLVRESRQRIYLLRTELGVLIEPRGASTLIQTGDGQEYRLNIDVTALRVDASFIELPSRTFIDEGMQLGLVARLATPAPREAVTDA
jgi:hypothetical protein